MIDPRPLDPPEYYEPIETFPAIIEYDCGVSEKVSYNEANEDSFYDEIIATIKWAIENNELLTIKIND